MFTEPSHGVAAAAAFVKTAKKLLDTSLSVLEKLVFICTSLRKERWRLPAIDASRVKGVTEDGVLRGGSRGAGFRGGRVFGWLR
jgi:hypothetical protein